MHSSPSCRRPALGATLLRPSLLDYLLVVVVSLFREPARQPPRAPLPVSTGTRGAELTFRKPSDGWMVQWWLANGGRGGEWVN